MATPIPFAYHRSSHVAALRRSPYAPWKPALEIAVTLVLFLVIQVAFVLVFFLTGISAGMGRSDFEDLLFGTGNDGEPKKMLFYYGALALTSLGAICGAWFAGRRPAALLSVLGRIRWKILRLSLAWIALPVAACITLDVLVNGIPAPVGKTFWLSMLIWATLIPLQCTAEELIFRGTLPQAIGAWVRSPVAAFGIALPFFVFGHVYDLAGLASVAVFAVMASVLVHRTGGLEAAIVLHSTNNMALAWADISGIQNLPEDSARLTVLAVSFVLQYGGAFAVLFVLRGLAPSGVARAGAQPGSLPQPGWYPGEGWFRGWPRVALRTHLNRFGGTPTPQPRAAGAPVRTVVPTRFHRTIRPWWSALIEAVVLAILFFVFNTAAFFLLIGIGERLGVQGDFVELPVGDIDVNVALLISLAMTCAAPLLAARVVGRDPAELLNVNGRIRWRIAWISAAATALVYSATSLIGWLIDGVPDFSLSSKGAAFILVCVLVVPFQAAAEELVFRSAIPQIVGAWVKSPLIAYGAAVPLFAAGHMYNWIGLTDIVVFAVCAAVLTWYTNGIEAAVALHAVGNIIAFSGLGLGLEDPTSYDVSPATAIFGIITTLLAVATTLWALRRWGGMESRPSALAVNSQLSRHSFNRPGEQRGGIGDRVATEIPENLRGNKADNA